MAVSTNNVPIYNVGTLPRIVPVVLPPAENLEHSGKVRNVPVFAGVDTSGWLSWDGEGGEDGRGDWVVIKRGYRLLRECYESEDNAKGWGDYRRYLKDWQKGLTQEPFPLDLLPKCVQEMQQGLVGAEKPDPWRRQRPKPTTGKLADVPAPTARRSRAAEHPVQLVAEDAPHPEGK